MPKRKSRKIKRNKPKRIKNPRPRLAKPRSRISTRFSKENPISAKRVGISLRGKTKRRLPKRKKAPLLIKGKVPAPFKTAPNEIHQTKIKVIGVGGGGSSIVSEIASRIKKASFVAANTDLQALKKLARQVKIFPFGQSLTHGLGTGMDSELGRLAGQNESEKIKKIVEGQDLCILIACLGGGVGSGAVPVFAKISKGLGNITYGIFTLPFKFEGEKKMEIARESLEKTKPYLNAITIIPNEEIFQIVDKASPLNTALSYINKNLAESLEGLIETIYEPGIINIDFADLRTIFEGRGRLTYLNTVEVLPSEINEEAVKKVITNPLYPYTVRGARGILLNISGPSLGLEEVSMISKTISELANKEAKIIFGVAPAKRKQGRIKITLLATGCGTKIFAPVEKKAGPKETESREENLKTGFLQLKEKTIRPKPVRKITIDQPRKGGVAPHGGFTLPRKKGTNFRSQKKTKKTAKEKEPAQKSGKENLKKEQTQESVSISPVLAGLPGPEKGEIKVRRNALQVKKALEEFEQEMINQERQWDVPAFLRRKLAHRRGES